MLDQFSGVNSGVLLMNLTRLRRFNWTSYIAPISTKYRGIRFFDQGIIDAILSNNSGKVISIISEITVPVLRIGRPREFIDAPCVSNTNNQSECERVERARAGLLTQEHCNQVNCSETNAIQKTLVVIRHKNLVTKKNRNNQFQLQINITHFRANGIIDRIIVCEQT